MALWLSHASSGEAPLFQSMAVTAPSLKVMQCSLLLKLAGRSAVALKINAFRLGIRFSNWIDSPLSTASGGLGLLPYSCKSSSTCWRAMSSSETILWLNMSSMSSGVWKNLRWHVPLVPFSFDEYNSRRCHTRLADERLHIPTSQRLYNLVGDSVLSSPGDGT